MSDRIRAAQIAAEALEFSARRALAVVRFAWAPILVSSLILGGAFGVTVNFEALGAGALMGAGGDDGPQDGASVFRFAAPLAIALLAAASAAYGILLGGVIANIARLAATGEDEGRVINVRIDDVARRTFAATLMVGAANFVLWVAALALAQGVTGVSAPGAARDLLALIADADASTGGAAEIEPGALAAFGLLGASVVLYLPVYAYVATRLAPFVAGAAVENRLILRRSFAMTRGHAWSIFAGFALLGAALLLMGLVISIGVGVVEAVAALLASFGGALAAAGGLLSVIAALSQAAFQFVAFAAQTAFGAIVYRRLAAE